MNNEKHTREPWRVDTENDTVILAQRNLEVCATYTSDVTPEEDEANARRIVACVNACAGYWVNQLESTIMEQGGFAAIIRDLGNEKFQAKQQRDELLAAIKAYLNENTPRNGELPSEHMQRSFKLIEAVHTAIAKAEAQS